MAKSTASTPNSHIAVIGAGWAGCAAALALARQGIKVSMIEGARILGGRARRVEVHGKILDNGQHIMLGAYSTCLSLMRFLEIDLNQAFLRLPLQMVYPLQTGMCFEAPRLPAPLHLLVALLRAKGLNRSDKMAIARFSTTARWMDWQLYVDCSVSELMERFDQTDRVCKLMWYPLCLAALNTPPEYASAQVFLNVLRDSLGAKRAASDMLIPRVNLSDLFPNAVAQYLEKNNGETITGTTIKQITRQKNGQMQIQANQHHPAFETLFDGVIVATNPEQTKCLLDSMTSNVSLHDASTQTTPTESIYAGNFDYEPISTCYLQYPDHIGLSRAFFALIDDPQLNHWGQFVFDRGQLHEDQKGLLAVVVSAATQASKCNKVALARAIADQLATQFRQPELSNPLWYQIVTEKRATFSCKPGLHRPHNQTSIGNLVIAGDFTSGDYPATLEAAVQSGNKAALTLRSALKKHSSIK